MLSLTSPFYPFVEVFLFLIVFCILLKLFYFISHSRSLFGSLILLTNLRTFA